MHHALIAGYANPLRVVDAADFDGTNDLMLRGAALTGIADSKKGIISAWARVDGGDGASRSILSQATSLPALFELTTGNVFKITSGAVLFLSSTSTYVAGATWRHVLISWDLGTAGARHLYVNDTDDLTVTTFTDATIPYTNATDWSVGADTNAANKFNGSLAELYFAPGQYLDFSNVYNRRKFISASGKPVHLGTTGALPTGTAPLVYLHLDNGEAVANFATNRGTGGDFAITGTLETASSSPSD